MAFRENKQLILQSIFHLIWFAILIICTMYIFDLPREKPVERNENLKVYIVSQNTNTNNNTAGYDCDADPKCVYRELEAQKAVEFGLEQMVSRINYFLTAAIAALAFISKLVLDPLLSTKNEMKRMDRRTLYLFWHSAIGFGISLFFGVIANLFLPEIVTYKYFSIYGYVGVATGFQLISFILATALFVSALVSIIYPYLKNQGKEGNRRAKNVAVPAGMEEGNKKEDEAKKKEKKESNS